MGTDVFRCTVCDDRCYPDDEDRFRGVFRMNSTLFFLPGVSGDTAFWKPVADRLTYPGERIHFGWPGFGPTPPDPSVNGIEDLVARVVEAIDGPTALIAQSMGGVVAVNAAHQCPERITHLVLSATSGGIDLGGFGVLDWRPLIHASNPSLPSWFARYADDLSAKIQTLEMPVLLLWGDVDPISPVAVGRRLDSLFPCSELHVVEGGNHNLANTHASVVAPLIDRHLAGSS
jgi:pimeloyl-ACP methyl ester carboxylesterase